MEGEFKVVTKDFVNVQISSDVTQFTSEKNFPKDLTISALKGKLELQTGCSCQTMKLEVFNDKGQRLFVMADDDAVLGSFAIDDGMTIHVTDPTVKAGAYEDVSGVKKYEMSQDEYDKRADSVRAFKERMKMGRFAEQSPEEQEKRQKEQAMAEQQEKDMAEALKIGDRCEVAMPGAPTRRGRVQYSGLTDFKDGYWVGIEYDEPVGKNNGSVQGKSYFTCSPKYGGFVKPQHVTVGDFPEEGFSDDEI